MPTTEGYNGAYTGAQIDGAIAAVPGKQDKITVVTVALPASGWSGNAQTVSVPGVLADETAQVIQPAPALASQTAYMAAGVLCSGQGAGTLTFTCQTAPAADLTVYVSILKAE